MACQVVPYTTEAEWHALRDKTIGASEVSGLFDIEGAFNTRFELWTVKSGKIERKFEENERMFWGKKLESAIAEGIAEKQGYTLIKPEGYYLHPTVSGMGCTPDFFIRSPKRKGKGTLEIKLVDYASFAKWKNEEPPLIYILQNQHQMSCTGCQWGAVGVLVNGNQLHVYEYERHEATIRKLEKAVEDFWLDVALNKEPKAVAEDYELVREYHAITGGEPLDLTGDNHLPVLCQAAIDAAERRRAAEKEERAAKSEIVQKLGGAEYAYTQGYTVSRKEIISNIKAIKAHERCSERLTIKEQEQ